VCPRLDRGHVRKLTVMYVTAPDCARRYASQRVTRARATLDKIDANSLSNVAPTVPLSRRRCAED
jgi:hypothetical protein